MNNRYPQASDRLVERQIGAATRRSFLTGGLAALAGFGAFRWIDTRRLDQGVAGPLRNALEANGRLAQAYSRPSRLAREFPAASAEVPRVNGTIGIDDDDFDPSRWSLAVDGLADRSGTGRLPLAAIQSLPKVDFVTELKCVEGWSKRVQWGGARLADFARQYAPASVGQDGYVALATPDGAYYVGLDMASAMHPQTLLCYEMNGQPLAAEHGAPLRLVIPIKYGIKNLKRIGRISFTRTRPPDYWAERGYDYYAGF